MLKTLQIMRQNVVNAKSSCLFLKGRAFIDTTSTITDDINDK